MLSVLAAAYSTATRMDRDSAPLRPFWPARKLARSVEAVVRRANRTLAS